MKKLARIFSRGFWQQLSIALVCGDNNYHSTFLWDYWKSYVGSDGKTYYDNWGILKAYLTA